MVVVKTNSEGVRKHRTVNFVSTGKDNQKINCGNISQTKSKSHQLTLAIEPSNFR